MERSGRRSSGPSRTSWSPSPPSRTTLPAQAPRRRHNPPGASKPSTARCPTSMTRCFGRLPSTTHPLLTTEHSRTGGSAESDSDAFGRLNIRRVFFAPSGTSCWGSSHKSAASCVTLLFSTTPVCTSRVASLPHRRSSRMGSPTITGATRCGPVPHRLAPTAPLVRGLHWPTRTPDKSSPSSCPRTAGAPRTSRRRASLRETELPEVVDRKVRAHYGRVLLADEGDD